MQISVIVPLYNKSKYVVRAIESILAQSDAVSEIIVVDDGSTDGGGELVQKHFADKITLISQQNCGVSKARNAGLAQAKSDYVAFLDADDYWYPQFISNIKQLKLAFPDAGMFCTAYEFFKDDALVKVKNPYLPVGSGVIHDYFAACCNVDLPVTASSVCINKALLLSVGGFPESIQIGEDQAVWGALACKTDIAYHSDVSVVYDLLASDSTRHFQQRLLLSPHVDLFCCLLTSDAAPSHLKESLQKLIHLSVMSCIKNNLIAGERSQAFDLLVNNDKLIWDKYRVIAFGLLILPKWLIARFYGYARNFR